MHLSLTKMGVSVRAIRVQPINTRTTKWGEQAPQAHMQGPGAAHGSLCSATHGLLQSWCCLMGWCISGRAGSLISPIWSRLPLLRSSLHWAYEIFFLYWLDFSPPLSQNELKAPHSSSILSIRILYHSSHPPSSTLLPWHTSTCSLQEAS